MTSALFSPGSVGAVAFDHDGTLVNSLPGVVAATNAALVEHGHAPCHAEAIVAGMVLATGPRMGLHAKVDDPAEQAVMNATYYKHARLLIPPLATLYPGVGALIETLTSRGLPLAVVSNSEGVGVRAVMQKLGILHYFTTVLGEEDAPAPKPDPRGLLRAAERMQREPWWCVFVGDSLPDRLVARNAGMRSIGVTWGIHPRHEMLDTGFDVLVDRADDIVALVAG